MKIVDSKQCTKFAQLTTGMVFLTIGQTYYMKIETVEPRYSKDLYNAVSLSDGGLYEFDDSELVTLVDCELVIK